MSKIVVIWDQLGQDPLKFFITENASFLKLDRVYINDAAASAKLERQLSRLMYNEDGTYKQTLLDVFPVEEVRNGATVIVCGFLP